MALPPTEVNNSPTPKQKFIIFFSMISSFMCVCVCKEEGDKDKAGEKVSQLKGIKHILLFVLKVMTPPI